jgi:hypothetical protein
MVAASWPYRDGRAGAGEFRLLIKRRATAIHRSRCRHVQFLVDEVRARRLLHRRRAGRARCHRALDRRARLAGTQLHGQADAGRRRRPVLSLELPAAGHRGHRAHCLGYPARSDAVRSRVALLRPGIEARSSPLGAAGRAGAAQDPLAGSARDACDARVGGHGGAAPWQPPFDHAGRSGALAPDRGQDAGLWAAALDRLRRQRRQARRAARGGPSPPPPPEAGSRAPCAAAAAGSKARR